MKRHVEREVEVEPTTEIGENVGFTTLDNRKGTLVYVGEAETLHAIILNTRDSLPNSSCGAIQENKYSSAEDFISRHKDVFSEHGICVTIDSFFFFDTVKELYRWLSE